MPSYADWRLPPNPIAPAPTAALCLAALRPGDTIVGYARRPGIIGLLDTSVAAQNVTEWVYPGSLLTSTMKNAPDLTRIERRGDELWGVASDFHGAIVRLVPATGVFTRFSTPTHGDPLQAPETITFDSQGDVWFLGSHLGASALCRLNADTGLLTHWPIPPAAMLNLTSITTAHGGTHVWFASSNWVGGNVGRQWIGCVEVATDTLTCYTPAHHLSDWPNCAGIAFSQDAPKDSVWFTAGASPTLPWPGIYRFDAAAGVAYKHQTVASGGLPWHITVEPTGIGWATDVQRHTIVRCDPAQSCSTLSLQPTQFKLTRLTRQLMVTQAPARPVTLTAHQSADTVDTVKYPCALEYNGDRIRTPEQIRNQMTGKHPVLFFVTDSTRIARLSP